jgi:hypothetical protein
LFKQSLSSAHAHAPLTHCAVPQLLPHAPQLLLSDAVSVQELEHRSVPVGHVHAPPTHVLGDGHATSHAPQLAESVCTCVQVGTP